MDKRNFWGSLERGGPEKRKWYVENLCNSSALNESNGLSHLGSKLIEDFIDAGELCGFGTLSCSITS